ncbi:potassium channel family protein [Methanobacterium paludis]|uniref:Ion transport 2 domain protein n=1 Tax=Methanobacterium paludis (strain DSM 25820 / JCM 18151 / SWAN1) TaxID=868131 RepID=F6D1P2_METPW|nr:ion channel [Methanobacterium paludis]AEG17845.1 Ion transport 2 domain protein [Methanobacterium paludis]
MKKKLKLFITTAITFMKEKKPESSIDSSITPTLKRFAEMFIIVLILLDIILLTIITFIPVSPEIYTLIVYFDLIVVLIIIPDFINKLLKSKDKKEFLKANWTDIIGMVPEILAPQVGFLFRYFRLIRIVSLFKKEIAHAFEFLHKTRIDYGFFIVILILFSGSMALFLVEKGVNSNIHSLTDALWFTLVTITTVGYGDISPKTDIGKVIAAIIMFTGIGFMGFLTATITSKLVERSEEEEEKTIHDKLDKLQLEMDELKELIKGK